MHIGCLSSTGAIKSPGYPGEYPENLDCTWTKSIPTYYYSRKIFRFYISNLDLEQCTRCACDYVEIFDGSSKSSKRLGKFCSGNIRLLSTGRHLTVVFHTDHSKGDKRNNGFQATYSSIDRSSGKILNIMCYQPYHCSCSAVPIEEFPKRLISSFANVGEFI